jgi:hypothetical protein
VAKVKENLVLIVLLLMAIILAVGGLLVQGRESDPIINEAPERQVADTGVRGDRYLGQEISIKVPEDSTVREAPRSLSIEGPNRAVVSISDLPLDSSLKELERQYNGQRVGNGIVYDSGRAILLIGPYRVDYLVLGPGSRAVVTELLTSTRLREE